MRVTKMVDERGSLFLPDWLISMRFISMKYNYPLHYGLDHFFSPPRRRSNKRRRSMESSVETLESRRLLSTVPTDVEQYQLFLINRLRANPPAEGQRLLAEYNASEAGTLTGPDAAPMGAFVQISKSPDTSGWMLTSSGGSLSFQTVISGYSPRAPLAFNSEILDEANNHVSWMDTNGYAHSAFWYSTGSYSNVPFTNESTGINLSGYPAPTIVPGQTVIELQSKIDPSNPGPPLTYTIETWNPQLLTGTLDRGFELPSGNYSIAFVDKQTPDSAAEVTELENEFPGIPIQVDGQVPGAQNIGHTTVSSGE